MCCLCHDVVQMLTFVQSELNQVKLLTVTQT